MQLLNRLKSVPTGVRVNAGIPVFDFNANLLTTFKDAARGSLLDLGSEHLLSGEGLTAVCSDKRSVEHLMTFKQFASLGGHNTCVRLWSAAGTAAGYAFGSFVAPAIRVAAPVGGVVGGVVAGILAENFYWHQDGRKNSRSCDMQFTVSKLKMAERT